MTVTLGTDVYITVADADTYWTARGNTSWTGASDATKEVALVKATDYLDRTFVWRGLRLTLEQGLEWPRSDAYTNDGFLVGATNATLPVQLTQACCILADLYRLGVVSLDRTITNDDAVTKKKVDVIEVSYDIGKRLSGGDVPVHVFDLLRPITVSSSRRLMRT